MKLKKQSKAEKPSLKSKLVIANDSVELQIRDLVVEINNIKVLNGINLMIRSGEVHAIMGPNGSGKSTLAKVIAGHPSYKILSGEIVYIVNGKKINLLTIEPHERAKLGLFLAFQYPVEISGVSNINFLRESYNEIAKYNHAKIMDPFEFNLFIQNKLELLDLNESFMSRSVNEGFSGGEKKKNEILQMAVLDPKIALLDETDSGLDIDSLKTVAKGINKLKTKNNAFVIVTHYQRILDYITPDFVHVLSEGKIVKTGGKELAKELEKKGYDWVRE